MKERKLTFLLAKFELTASPAHLLVLFLFSPLLITIIVLFVVQPQLNEYLQTNYVGFDLLFLFFFLTTPAWLKPRRFLVQSLDEQSELWASPTYVLQLQWPIAVKTLINSRLLLYFFISFPLQCIFLFVLYIIPSQLQTVISPGEYVIFCILWLAAGIHIGYVMPASDVGDLVNKRSITIAIVLISAGLIALLTFFHLIFGHGLFHSTIFLAKDYPVSSTVSSIVLAILGLKYWQFYMKKHTAKNDYF